MIFFVCECGLALRTVGDPEEVDCLVGTRCEMYPNNYKCPQYGCGGRMQFAESIESESLAKLDVVDLTPSEVFSAFNGLGLPKERDCGETAVRELLMGQKVTGVELRQIRGANRTVVHSIELEGGRRVHLAASPDGPVAYRISSLRRYVEEFLDE